MKVNNFSNLIEGDFQSITGKTENSNAETWEISVASPDLIIRSNLEKYERIYI